MISLTEKIIEGCKRRNTKAQMQFYNMFYKVLYNCCYRILPNSMDAEDAMQESFIKAFDKIDTIGNAPPEAWLRRIAINTSIDKLKKRRMALVELDDRMPVLDDEPYDEEEVNWKVEQVKKSIAQLPDGHRLILTLHLLEGYNYDEIAEILNIKEGTARGQFTRARQKLIELLKQQDILCA
ncbi:MAG: RNA polymerase sigma factor [Prevotellaceae bacterium]|jgi:RNA polymerase sigma-70 factor (ECF subfamily)|nr:RNA polymerase sigma factor [Prevotellaceae bacterium]